MVLPSETKQWLRAKGIDASLFPLLQKTGLVKIDMLTAVTLHDLKRIAETPVARYLFYKIHPPEPLLPHVEQFIVECDIPDVNMTFLRRLSIQNVSMLRFVSSRHLTDVGMDAVAANYVVGTIKKGLEENSLGYTPHDIQSSSSSSEDVSEEDEEDDDSQEDDSQEDDDPDPRFIRHEIVRYASRKKSGRCVKETNAKRRRVTVPSTSSAVERSFSVSRDNQGFNAFQNATKLHLADYTKEQFLKYHDKYHMQRKRTAGNRKWTYRVYIDGANEGGGSLKQVMDMCLTAEQKANAVATLGTGFGSRRSKRNQNNLGHN